MAADVAENGEKHGFGQAAGERILLAGVVSSEEARKIAGQLIRSAMAERIRREGFDESALPEHRQVAAEGD